MGGDDDGVSDRSMAQLQPLIDIQSQISRESSTEGLGNVASARGDLEYVSDYFKKLFEGSDEDLLKILDADGATRNLDENEQMLSELGVRGGRRAADLGQSAFDKDATLDRLLKQLRSAAPTQIAQIAQTLGNLGLGELSASVGAGAQASNTIFGIEEAADRDSDRRTALLGGILETIGGFAGVLACVAVGDSYILTPEGDKLLKDLEIGAEVCSFDVDTGEEVIRKISRVRIAEDRTVMVISANGKQIRPTLSHVFTDDLMDEDIVAEDLEDSDELTLYIEKAFIDYPVKLKGTEASDVIIVKLDDEDASYPMVINGFLCLDDDSLVEV
jgi:hypothetical protein